MRFALPSQVLGRLYPGISQDLAAKGLHPIGKFGSANVYDADEAERILGTPVHETLTPEQAGAVLLIRPATESP